MINFGTYKSIWPYKIFNIYHFRQTQQLPPTLPMTNDLVVHIIDIKNCDTFLSIHKRV